MTLSLDDKLMFYSNLQGAITGQLLVPDSYKRALRYLISFHAPSIQDVAYELTKINQNRVLLWVVANGGAGEVDVGGRGLLIRTPEGHMLASWGDFVIRGVQGEFYPCKPEIFHLTYEAL